MGQPMFARQDGSSIPNPAANPSPQTGTVLAGSSALFVASVGLVVLRFCSRILHRTSRGRFGLWWDDWLALLALIAYTPAFAIVCAIFAPNAGRHISEFGFEQQAFGNTAMATFALFFMYSMFSARCSALLFYHRVFVTSRKDWFRWVLVALHMYNLCALVAFMSLLPFNCRLTDTATEREHLGCIDTRTMYIGSAAASFSCDLVILLAPMLRISHLKLSSRFMKLIVAIPFTCGIIVVAVSLGRLIVTVEKASLLDVDPTFSGMEVMWWPIAEMAAALMSVCLPSIYGLVRVRLSDQHPDPSRVSLDTGSSGGMLIEKSVTIGTPPPGSSPHQESIASPLRHSHNVSNRPLPPTPPSLAQGNRGSVVSTIYATSRTAPARSEQAQELPGSRPSRKDWHHSPSLRQPRQTTSGTGRIKMPRSIYCAVPPENSGDPHSAASQGGV